MASSGHLPSGSHSSEGIDLVAEPEHNPGVLRGSPQAIPGLPTGSPASRLGLQHPPDP